MNIEDVEAMVPDFTESLISYLETTQKELKAITVQKVFSIISKRKNAKKLGEQSKTPEFWQRVHSNIELFKLRVENQIESTLSVFTSEEKINFLFEYFDKETKD